MAPRFEVDPLWPKPLPNHWYIGMSIGVAVDAQDHVWIVHRPDTVSANEAAADQKTGDCCSKAPPVLEFDQAGNLIGHWGGRVRATNGPSRITESQSTIKAMFGSAATARTTLTS